MSQIPQPSTIVSAAVVMQLFLFVIATSGAFIIDRNERSAIRFYENPKGVGKQAWVIIVFAIATLGALVLSDGFAGSWFSLSSPTSVSIFAWHHALIFVFAADIILTLILVLQTGGSHQSPFTSLYFILPSLAFFLRESATLIVVYVALVALCFSIGLVVVEGPRQNAPSTKFPFWLVSVLCLILSLMIGLMTRPH